VISFMPARLLSQRAHMLRMRWNRRMSSFPASSARPAPARVMHAVILSVVPVMCFMIGSLPFSYLAAAVTCADQPWSSNQVPGAAELERSSSTWACAAERAAREAR